MCPRVVKQGSWRIQNAFTTTGCEVAAAPIVACGVPSHWASGHLCVVVGLNHALFFCCFFEARTRLRISSYLFVCRRGNRRGACAHPPGFEVMFALMTFLQNRRLSFFLEKGGPSFKRGALLNPPPELFKPGHVGRPSSCGPIAMALPMSLSASKRRLRMPPPYCPQGGLGLRDLLRHDFKVGLNEGRGPFFWRALAGGPYLGGGPRCVEGSSCACCSRLHLAKPPVL